MSPMTLEPIEKFIATWRDSTLTERAAAQEYFIGLCHLLGLPSPAEADLHGVEFCFEKGVKKTGGGWADVWKQGCFAWEYKGQHKNLGATLRQLQQYGPPALDNPPLLIVSNFATMEIHTSFTNTVVQVYRLTLDDLRDPEKRQRLYWAFTDPDRLKPARTREAVTEDAAKLLGALAQRLRQRGHEPQRVAHGLTRLLFCLFAEAIGLLPHRLFSDLLAEARRHPDEFPALASELFGAM